MLGNPIDLGTRVRYQQRPFRGPCERVFMLFRHTFPAERWQLTTQQENAQYQRAGRRLRGFGLASQTGGFASLSKTGPPQNGWLSWELLLETPKSVSSDHWFGSTA